MPSNPCATNLPAQTFVQQPAPSLAAESLLARAFAAPAAPGNPTLHHLTESNRFGDTLATYLAPSRPRLCPDLSASPAFVTHVWYAASFSCVYNLAYLWGNLQHIHL